MTIWQQRKKIWNTRTDERTHGHICFLATNHFISIMRWLIQTYYRLKSAQLINTCSTKIISRFCYVPTNIVAEKLSERPKCSIKIWFITSLMMLLSPVAIIRYHFVANTSDIPRSHVKISACTSKPRRWKKMSLIQEMIYR